MLSHFFLDRPLGPAFSTALAQSSIPSLGSRHSCALSLDCLVNFLDCLKMCLLGSLWNTGADWEEHSLFDAEDMGSNLS